VIVLDELEKAIEANPELQGVLLPVLDEAKMVDPRGVTARFEEIVVVATSNAIVKLSPEEQLIFKALSPKERKTFVVSKLLTANKGFTPEFLNRFDDFVFANDLTAESFLYIIQKEVGKFERDVLSHHAIKVDLTESAREQMVKEIMNQTRGSGRDAVDIANDRVREVYNLAVSDRVYINQAGQPVEFVIEDGERWIIDYKEGVGYTHSIAP
jgi:ATP-dependent Clp protease ATP-binding subunit ClpA